MDIIELLKFGEIIGHDLPYFTKDKFLSKSHIVSLFANDRELAKYLPDNINLLTVTNSSLLSFLFDVCPKKYTAFYIANKDKKSKYAR